MTQRDRSSGYLRQGRRNRLLRELQHDPYHAKRKIHGPAVCSGCGATYVDGRWHWGPAAAEAADQTCPACARIADRVPAAFLTISGEFASAHRDEIAHLIRNYEDRERAEHPLKRIMAESVHGDVTEVTFTDAHLARGIGEALQRAYGGELDFRHEKGEVMLRVSWHR